jgi:amino acid permease
VDTQALKQMEDDDDEGLTPWQTSLNLVKATIGAGSMGVPYAFKLGGPLPFSFVVTLLMGALCAYTIVLLVKTERRLAGGTRAPKSSADDQLSEKFISDDMESDQRTNILLTYPEVGEAAFPELTINLCGFRVNLLAALLHVIVQVIVLGVCVAYIDFIASTLPVLWPHAFNALKSILVVLPFFLATAFLRSFRFLAVTSIIGDVAVIGTFIAVIAYGFADDNYGKLTLPTGKIDGDVMGFVNTVTFLFAVHANMLPIAQAMKRPEEEFEPTLYKTFAFIVILNAVFALLCYSLFGDDVASPVTHNLGCLPGGIDSDNTCTMKEETSAATNAVVVGIQVLLCVDLLFTLPILLAAAREIIEEKLVSLLPRDSPSIEYVRNVTRTFLVLLICLIAYEVPQFADVLNILGGLFQSIIAFVVPPLVFNRVFRDELSMVQYTLNVLITLFGVGMAAYSVVGLFTGN